MFNDFACYVVYRPNLARILMCFVDDIKLTIPIRLVHNIVVQRSVLFGFCVSRLVMSNERECYTYF
jgi:hypothetical protein